MNDNEKWLDDVVRELKKPVEEDPAAKARIMRSIREQGGRRPGRERGAWGAFLEWMVRGRAVTVSPLAVVACALVVAVVVGGRYIMRAQQPRVGIEASDRGTRIIPREEALRLAFSAKPGESLVKFALIAPEASRVAVIGDFNNWDPGASPLREENGSGVWTVIVPLPAGRHEYAFLVDGEYWLPDPNAPRTPKDDFDRMNSIMLIGGQVN